MTEPIKLCGLTVKPYRDTHEWRTRIGDIDVRIWLDSMLSMYSYHVTNYRDLSATFSSESLRLAQMIERIESLIRRALDDAHEGETNRKELMDAEHSWYWRSHPSRHDFRSLPQSDNVQCAKCGYVMRSDLALSKYAGPIRFGCKGAP